MHWEDPQLRRPDFLAISPGPSPIRLQIYIRRPQRRGRLGAGTIKSIATNAAYLTGWQVLVATNYGSTPRAREAAKIVSRDIPALNLRVCSFHDCLKFLADYGTPPAATTNPEIRAATHLVVVGTVTPELLEKLAQSRSTLEDALRVGDPRFFEELIAENWRAEGYDVELVRRLNAGGPDVIATKRESVVPMKILTSCKWRSPKYSVKKLDVEELMAWVEQVYPANAGLLVTNTYLQEGALELTQRFHRVQALDRDGVVDWTLKLWKNEEAHNRA